MPIGLTKKKKKKGFLKANKRFVVKHSSEEAS